MKLESIGSAYLNETELKEIGETFNGKDFKSSFSVFSDHNGFMRGEFHTFIGPKGSGKSTYSKTILCDLIDKGKTVFLYLSEEERKKYLAVLNKAMLLNYPDNESRKKALEKIIVVSELDYEFKHPKDLFNYIKEVLDLSEVDVFIFDNFTTSFVNELPINIQSEILRGFKKMATSLNIPVLMFFHTGKNTDKTKLDGDNVRGSATAINIGSYNYVISQHRDAVGTLRNFIYTEKARYHPMANKSLYEMSYDHRVGLFVKCSKTSLEAYKEIITESKKQRGEFV